MVESLWPDNWWDGILFSVFATGFQNQNTVIAEVSHSFLSDTDWVHHW
jgi:hypothetical protein